MEYARVQAEMPEVWALASAGQGFETFAAAVRARHRGVLVTCRRTEGLVLGILGLINCGLFMFAGVSRALWTRQIRRNAAQALELNQDSK
jgi:hypothetical protein